MNQRVVFLDWLRVIACFMVMLVPVVDCFRQHLSPAATMIAAAVATYILASAAGVVLRRIPFIGRFIVG